MKGCPLSMENCISGDNMKSKIGESIDKKGLKNKFIAQQLGVTQVQVSKWRSGKSYPRVDKLFRLAALLGERVDDLYEMDSHIGNSENEEKVDV